VIQSAGGKVALTQQAQADVTIVIPCYRHAHYLEECLTSVRAQTHAAWKAIVVDDCSPDEQEIRKVVERFADPRIRIVRHEVNRGLGASRNTGIRASDTELVLPLDSDDRLAPVARRRAGDAYRASGSDALALAQYEELLVRYPRSWLAPETRRLVQELRAKAGNTP